MGIMTNYTEATAMPYGLYRFTNLEWYIQDNWKASRRLTLDYGVRFYHDAGQEEVRGQTAAFVQGMYNPANAPVLITSGRDAANARVGVDPLTGKQYNIAFIGTFAPGHGDPSIGMVSGGTKGFPHSLYWVPVVLVAPRVGFAYALSADGRTALRGGAGIFFDRVQGNPTMNMAANPPTSFSPTLYYSTFTDLVASAIAHCWRPRRSAIRSTARARCRKTTSSRSGFSVWWAVRPSSKWLMSATSRAICCGSATSTRYRWGRSSSICIRKTATAPPTPLCE